MRNSHRRHHREAPLEVPSLLSMGEVIIWVNLLQAVGFPNLVDLGSLSMQEPVAQTLNLPKLRRAVCSS